MELYSTKFNSKLEFQNNAYKNTQEDMGQDSAKESIDILCSDLDNACDYKDAKIKLAMASENNIIERINETTYKNGDYVIRTFLKVSGENQATMLNKLTSQDISIAPKLIYSKNYGDYTIIITKIDGLSEGKLIPFNQGYNTIGDSAKTKAYKDTQKLLKLGYINQAMLNGNSAWYITPKSKKIVVLDWKNLRKVQDGEATSILNNIHQTIFRNN